MAIETGTTIAELSRVDPTAADYVSEADNHMRLIKSVLKDQFPGELGDGYAIAIIATEAELNRLTGVTADIEPRIASNTSDIADIQQELFAPGTRMLFNQPSCPTGWTIDASIDNHLLRVSDTAGGGTGGADDPFTASHLHGTASHQLTVPELPAHDHIGGLPADSAFTVESFYGTANAGQGIASRSVADSTPDSDIGAITGPTGDNVAHNHGNTLEHVHSPLYTDVIVCVKD